MIGTTAGKHGLHIVAVVAFAICALWATIGGASTENFVQSGKTFFDSGDYKNALAEYDKAIEHDPKNAEAYCGRARVRLMAEQNDLALADADKALALDSKFLPAFEVRAYIKTAQKDYEGAIAEINQAIALEPENALWYIVRGEIYGEQGNLAQSRADYDQGRKDSRAIDKLKEIDSFGRGTVHYIKDEADDIAHYTHILEVNPKAEKAHYRRGRLYAEQKEYENALADFTEAITLSPDNPEYYEHRAWCYHCLGRDVEADVDIEKAKELRANE